MPQRAGAQVEVATITADNAEPTGDDGIAISAFGYGDKAPDAIHVDVAVSGTTPSGLLAIRTRGRTTATWGAGGENDGFLNFGEPITKSCHFTIRDVGACDRLAIFADSVSGTNPEFVVTMTALFNEPS